MYIVLYFNKFKKIATLPILPLGAVAPIAQL